MTRRRAESFESYPQIHERMATHNQARLPQRTTKITQKLVLFPDPKDGERRYEAKSADEELQSIAERLKKSDRLQIPRVTSFCLAESFNLTEVVEYLNTSHGISPKQYDECLYFSYEGPSKEMKFGDPAAHLRHIPLLRSTSIEGGGRFASFPNLVTASQEDEDDHPSWMDRGEVFMFDYGVLVLWNFTVYEEISFIAHVKNFTEGPLQEEDIEVEDFHFQYDLMGPYQPRIYNDMITIKSASPMIKLTISHGLSQSVKLSLFENIMEATIEGAVPLPKQLAQYGVVRMSRTKIMKIVGRLYKLKMNVNLISNVLGMCC
jgi:uncharacterized Rmd1/YagE family protein